MKTKKTLHCVFIFFTIMQVAGARCPQQAKPLEENNTTNHPQQQADPNKKVPYKQNRNQVLLI